MAKKKQKPAPLPIIDLVAQYQVIDEATNRWKTIDTGVWSDAHALRVMDKHNLQGVWIYALNEREYKTRSDIAKRLNGG